MYIKQTSLIAKILYTTLSLGSKYILCHLKLLRFVRFSLLMLLECSSREMKFQVGPKQPANQRSSFFSDRDIYLVTLALPSSKTLCASRKSRTNKDVAKILPKCHLET